MNKRKLNLGIMVGLATLSFGTFGDAGTSIHAAVVDYYQQSGPVDDDDVPPIYGYGLAYLEKDDFSEDGPANAYWKYLHPIKGYVRRENVPKKQQKAIYLYKVDHIKSFLKTKKRLWIGKTATGKKFWVKKGTVLNVGAPDGLTGVMYKKYTPYVVFRTDNLHNGYKIKTVNPIKLRKKVFAKVAAPSTLYHKSFGPRVTRAQALVADSAVPTTSIHVTSDNYLEFNQTYKYSNQTLQPKYALKIQKMRVKGQTTYLYYNQSIKAWDPALNDKKVGQYYRLAITATKTKYFYNHARDYETYPVEWFNMYKVGGKPFVLQKS